MNIKVDISESMEEICKLLQVYAVTGPGFHQKEYFTIRCYCDFEPWGLASENWDVVWRIYLNTIPAAYYLYDPDELKAAGNSVHARANVKPNRMQHCNGENIPHTITAKTLDELIFKTKAFLEDYKKFFGSIPNIPLL
jgi:hypothetical protein